MPPSANAGADFTINEGATGQLQGTATDPDNDPLTMEWYQTPTWPPLTLTNASDPRTTIVAPQVDGDTTITLILSVSDGDYTVTDQVRITITDIPEPQGSSESTTPPQLPPPVQEPAYNDATIRGCRYGLYNQRGRHRPAAGHGNRFSTTAHSP